MEKQASGLGFCLSFLAAVNILLAGCVTKVPCAQRLPPPPSEAIRAGLGTVGILSSTLTNNLSTQKPMTRSAGAGQGAMEGAIWGLSAGADAARGSSPGGGLVAVAVWSVTVPVGVLVGSIAGQSQGESKQKINRDDQILHEAINGQEIQNFLVAELQRNASEHAGRQLQMLSGEKLTSPTDITNFQCFTGSGVDTVMEIEIRNAGLCGYEGTGKSDPLTAFIQVRVRLIRVRDNKELYTHTWLRTGEEYPLSGWVESNGRPLRQGLMSMTPPLAENIIEELFLVYEPRTKKDGSSED